MNLLELEIATKEMQLENVFAKRRNLLRKGMSRNDAAVLRYDRMADDLELELDALYSLQVHRFSSK